MTDAPVSHLLREADGDAEGALILLHGRGATEADLHPLLDLLDPDRRLLGICPGAPISGLPPGGRHWYVVRQVGSPDLDTFMEAVPLGGGLLDGILEERGIPWSRAVIGGFSQGCVVSLALGLGRGRQTPAGILGMSGFLPQVEGWPLDAVSRPGLPVWLSHGTLDQVIPVEFGRAARDALEGDGLSLTYRETDFPHAIDPGLIPEIEAWLEAALSRD